MCDRVRVNNLALDELTVSVTLQWGLWAFVPMISGMMVVSLVIWVNIPRCYDRRTRLDIGPEQEVTSRSEIA